jgi:hypothetical protein
MLLGIYFGGGAFEDAVERIRERAAEIEPRVAEEWEWLN